MDTNKTAWRFPSRFPLPLAPLDWLPLHADYSRLKEFSVCRLCFLLVLGNTTKADLGKFDLHFGFMLRLDWEWWRLRHDTTAVVYVCRNTWGFLQCSLAPNATIVEFCLIWVGRMWWLHPVHLLNLDTLHLHRLSAQKRGGLPPWQYTHFDLAAN